MIYLLDGTETYKLAQKKHELLKRPDLLESNIVSISASNEKDFSMLNVLTQCNTISLFSDQRAVILEDPYFLKTRKGKASDEDSSKKKKSKKGDDPVELLEQYIQHPSDTTDLIFYCFGFDADKRTREYKLLSSYFNKGITHVHFGELSANELQSTLDRALQKGNYHLSREAYQELTLRIGGSTTDFYRAMEKLDLYGEKNLELTDIQHLVPVSTNVNIWKFTDCFIQSDVEGCFRSLKELTEIENMQTIGLMSMLASKLRGTYNVLVLKENGVRNDEITRRTGHRYPDMDVRSAHNRSSRVFLGWLKQLADLDQAIKSGQVNDVEGFQAFLLRNL